MSNFNKHLQAMKKIKDIEERDSAFKQCVDTLVQIDIEGHLAKLKIEVPAHGNADVMVTKLQVLFKNFKCFQEVLRVEPVKMNLEMEHIN